MPSKTPPIESLYKVDPDTGCWIWQRSFTTYGYGQVRRDNRNWGAHRWMYFQLVGPLAHEVVLDHLCRNRACVNPAHLEPVTHRVNILRGIHPPADHAKQTHCIHGHPFDEANTRIYTDPMGYTHRYCRACNAAFNRRRRAAATAKRNATRSELAQDS